MKNYNLGFISDADIYEHVESTMMQYRRSIDLKSFNKNLIDPIKLTFDSKIYGQDLQQTIESECLRQVDKTNNNCIGYFHQTIFKKGHGDRYISSLFRVDEPVPDDSFQIYSHSIPNHNLCHLRHTECRRL